MTPLVSGLFNITENYPVILDLVKTKDERTAFVNFVKNKEEFKDNIFVFDRGYVSDKLFKFMNDDNLLFICRIKDNCQYITDKNDNVVISAEGVKLRIITYMINGKPYYIATNVYDYTL